MIAMIAKLAITLTLRYIAPPSAGSRVYKASAENVVSPAQNPGNQKCLWSVLPRRSMRTNKKVAMATPNRFVIRVDVRELLNNSPIV
jgi:hypothetical protein